LEQCSNEDNRGLPAPCCVATSKGAGDIMMQSISALQAASLSYLECAHTLRSDIQHGLASAEISRRQKFSGYNEFDIQEHEPLWRKYLDQFKNPLIMLLLASAAVSLLMGRTEDAISITIAIVIVVSVGFVQEYRSEKTLEHLNKLVPPTCHT
uniref:Cation_ATPase_N domain-containing protein n=1 Tax=Gongylonema pulchrum TaxID=637853 RepID=A0A183EUF6_9BILA